MYPDRPSAFSTANSINIFAPVGEAPEQCDSLFRFQNRGMSTWQDAGRDGNLVRGLHRNLYAVLLQKTTFSWDCQFFFAVGVSNAELHIGGFSDFSQVFRLRESSVVLSTETRSSVSVQLEVLL